MFVEWLMAQHLKGQVRPAVYGVNVNLKFYRESHPAYKAIEHASLVELHAETSALSRCCAVFVVMGSRPKWLLRGCVA